MQRLLESIAAGRLEPLYLVHGDRTLAEPAGDRLAAAIARQIGVEPVVLRRPGELADVIADLKTFALFSTGKVVVVVESGALADKSSAAALFDEVRAQLPWSGGAEELSGKARDAALRLLQILRLFDIEVGALGAEKALAELPAAVFAGKSGRAAKAKGAVDELRAGLRPLLDAALAAGLKGFGESELSLLADLVHDGLPAGHVLVLVESEVAESHPLAKALAGRDAVFEAGALTLDKGRFVGLEALAAELERETGVGIERQALATLAERTLRSEDFRQGAPGAVDARSTARLAGEYRKLANLAGKGVRIDVDMVQGAVEDRGEEQIWGILDAIGAGKAAEAMSRLSRKLAGAEDAVLERLAIFSNLATLCRRIVAIRGIAAATGVALSEKNYKRFEASLFAKLTGEVAGLETNPLAGTKSAYPLFKAYQTAGRLPPATVDRLPALLLETERRLKGESGEPDVALAELVLAVALPR